MARKLEQVDNRIMDGKKSLQLPRGFVPLYRLSLPRWLMGILGSIIQALVRCSTPGMTSRFAAPYDRNLLVIMTRGADPCRFRSLRIKRLAAFVLRRLCTKISKTKPF